MAVKLSDKVYLKDFTKREVGYDVREVDSFLDDMNLSIRKLEREMELLQKEALSLQQTIKELQTERIALRAEMTRIESLSNTKSSYNNIDMIQRLSRIEDALHQLMSVKKMDN